MYGSLALRPAGELTQADLDRWQTEYLTVVAEGERLFHGGLGNENTVSCDQCHPNASNTHPETYPKFQKQLGKVADQWEMINWCIMNPLQSAARRSAPFAVSRRLRTVDAQLFETALFQARGLNRRRLDSRQTPISRCPRVRTKSPPFYPRAPAFRADCGPPSLLRLIMAVPRHAQHSTILPVRPCRRHLESSLQHSYGNSRKRNAR